MKQRYGRVLRAVIALALCMVMGLMCTAPALAAEKPTAMAFDKFYKLTPGFSDFLGTFRTTARGFVKLVVSGDAYLVELKQGDKVCWASNNLLLEKGGKQTYTIGLAKGKYTLSFRGDSGAKVKVSFTKNNYYEVEPNNQKATATKLTLGKQYGAVFGDRKSDLVNQAEDYYKVKLVKGKKYTVQFTQYKKLFEKDAPMGFVIVENPSGLRLVNAVSEYALGRTTLPTNGKVKFTANVSGWYTIALKPGWFKYKTVSYKICVK